MLKGLWRAILSSSLLATMCCFPSVVLVLFGLSSVSAAASLSDTLYWGGEGWGWFRPTLLAVSAATLAAGVVLHFRRSGVYAGGGRSAATCHCEHHAACV